jgi:hypothetical protein
MFFFWQRGIQMRKDLPSFFRRGRYLCAFFLTLAVLLSVATSLLPKMVQAVTVVGGYQASVISLDYPRELAPGMVGQVTVQFQNIGATPWLKDGKNFVSLYRWDPRSKVELASAFARPSWETTKRPTRIPMPRVNPGGSIDLAFPVAAPSKPGIYREEFVLAAENLAWIAYSPFVIEVRVGSAGAVASPSPQPTTPTVSTPASGEWRAEVISKGGLAWQVDLNQTIDIRFLIKNTGTRTWKREGAGYVSLYSVDRQNKERNSPFAPSAGWLSRAQVVKMQEAQTAPGETATFLFPVRAPKVPGRYDESFSLAAEDMAWIAGSAITIPVTVPLTTDFIATAPPGTDFQTPITPGPIASGKYAATLLLRSATSIKVVGGARAEMTVGFKNVGTEIWGSRSIQLKSVRAVQGDESISLRDQSWNGATEAVSLLGATKPGEIAFASFAMRTPMRRGEYLAVFQLYGDTQPIEGGEVEIPITITTDANQVLPTPIASTPVTPRPTPTASPSSPSFPVLETAPLTGDVSTLPAEPIMRVGLFRTTDDQMQIRALQSSVIVQQNGSEVCRLAPGQSTTVRYDRVNRVYVLQGGACASQSTQWYVFRSEDGLAPMEISDFSRPVGWLPGANDNTFRAQLELRYTPATDAVWIINELPFEYYLRGIAETSDVSPQQFQRTLLTAARTYGLYHIQRGTKHANEFYHVDARYDQVYRGYGAEARSPNIVAGIEATRGQIVTYNGKIAITPYFSRSDGRTRSWGEVWYGGSQYPWLVGVPVPEDTGRTLWGHGVGMSASGALDMARAGKQYDTILKHFYTGIELRRAYK